MQGWIISQLQCVFFCFFPLNIYFVSKIFEVTMEFLPKYLSIHDIFTHSPESVLFFIKHYFVQKSVINYLREFVSNRLL